MSEVKRAFTAVGVPVRSFPGAVVGPETLVPRDPNTPLFSVIVYGPEAVSGPIGLRFSNANNVVVRVRNVVVSYPAASSVTGQVQEAVKRLRTRRN